MKQFSATDPAAPPMPSRARTQRLSVQVGLALAGAACLVGASAQDASAAITYKANSAKASATPATSLYFGKPSTVVEGDVLVATVQASTQEATISAPSGWTLRASANAGTSSKVATYTKVAGATESSSYGFKFSLSGKHTGTLAAYSGVDPADPVDAVQSQSNAAGKYVACPSVSASVAGAMLVCTTAQPNGSSLYYRSPLTRRNNSRTGTTVDDNAIALGDELRVESGSTGPRSVEATSTLPVEASVGTSVLLKPESGAEPPPVVDRNYFNGDFDTGDFSQWSGVQRVSPDRLALTTDVVRQGSHAARFEVQPGDCWKNGGGSCSARAELETDQGARLRFYEGDDRYLGWSTRFDASWPTSNLWAIFIQFHGNDNLKPPLSMEAVGDKVFTRGFADGAYFTGTKIPLEREAWNDFVMHIKFSSDPNVGFVEVWRNGVKFQERVYRKTLASTYIYPKIGIYTSGSYTVPRILWHDEMRVGNTFGSVAAR